MPSYRYFKRAFQYIIVEFAADMRITIRGQKKFNYFVMPIFSSYVKSILSILIQLIDYVMRILWIG